MVQLVWPALSQGCVGRVQHCMAGNSEHLATLFFVIAQGVEGGLLHVEQGMTHFEKGFEHIEGGIDKHVSSNTSACMYLTFCVLVFLAECRRVVECGCNVLIIVSTLMGVRIRALVTD